MRPAAAFLLLALALAVAGCGSAEEARPLPEGVTGEAPPAETEPAETEPAPEEPEAPEEGDAEAGAEVFATAGCGSCHTLADAGTTGTIGVNLDEAQPTFDEVVEIVANGRGVMPAFADQLTEQQIRDVAAYVAESTR